MSVTNVLARKTEISDVDLQHLDQVVAATNSTDISAVSRSLSIALTENNFIVRDRMAAALAKIACAHKPKHGGGFSHMSREDTMNMARIVCALAGIRCTAAAAWAGEVRPERYRAKPKKHHLTPRTAPVACLGAAE